MTPRRASPRPSALIQLFWKLCAVFSHPLHPHKHGVHAESWGRFTLRGREDAVCSCCTHTLTHARAHAQQEEVKKCPLLAHWPKGHYQSWLLFARLMGASASPAPLTPGGEPGQPRRTHTRTQSHTHRFRLRASFPLSCDTLTPLPS